MSTRAAERRTRLDPAERRAQLIALGLEMLATRTLDELSVEDLALKAGISRGLLFHYFASKREFRLAVAQAAADDLLARTAPEPADDPDTALRRGLEAFLAYVEENPDNYRSLVRGASAGEAELRAIAERTRATMAGRVLDVLAGAGLVAGPRVALAVHGWVAFVEECVVRAIDARQPRDGLVEMLAAALPALVLVAGEPVPADVQPKLSALR